jgi:signal transduction histidine kinase
MTSRIILALLAAAIVTLASAVTWRGLTDHEQQQIARIAESESYAARSRLVRSVDTMLRALRDVHIYWSTFGHLPRDQWANDASIELAHFSGIELILWTEPNNALRFARNAANPVFDHRPNDQEWDMYHALLEKSQNLSGEHMLGPYVTARDEILLEVYFVPKSSRIDGTLIAVIDTRKALRGLLGEDSPGFAITVKAGDTVIYQRGEPGKGLPENWTRSGFIETSVGTVWEVIHTPTAELADSMRTPAINAVLYAGVAIAVLMGLLLIETGRANSRAKAAIRAQADLAELNLDLEGQVADRTQDLEERSRDLVTITDSVGHDLRNPLNSISANIQLLEQQFAEPLGRDGEEILERLSSGVRQMVDILDRLLSLSTVSNTEFERERLDMREMAEEIFSELEVSEPGAAVDFLAEDVPNAMGEPVLVQTLLMNLFSNALKYTRSKSVRKVMFSFEIQDGAPAYYVQDNGIGFDSKMAERIFSAFERLPNNGETDGLGLGLDIASRVVRRHEGRIWAEGEPDGGATFWFTLGEQGVVS